MYFFACLGDTFDTHAKLHKWGMLPLPIIIPEHDLKHPIVNIVLDAEAAVIPGTSCAPQLESDVPESSWYEVSQSTSVTTQQDTEIDKDDSDDKYDGDEDDDGTESHQSKKSLCSYEY